MDQAHYIERLSKDGVSIIMLSRDKTQFIEACIRSVLAQTYTNWELIVVDDSSEDGTIRKVLRLKDELDKNDVIKIKVLQTVFKRGKTVNRNLALREVHGRWIAFLDAGDVWEPTKLEKQVQFMEEHDYAFSYTKFDNIDAQGKKLGVMMSGPECVTYHELQKCCWLGDLTVMYDRDKIGLLQVKGMEEANDYALWLQVARKDICHLLPECLASQMSEKGLWYRLLTSEKWVWRYAAYRKIEHMNPLSAVFMTVRNLAYTAWKWWRYAERV